MLIPLVMLYEGGIWCIWLLERRHRQVRVVPDDDRNDSHDLIASFLLPLLTGRMYNGHQQAGRVRPRYGR